MYDLNEEYSSRRYFAHGHDYLNMRMRMFDGTFSLDAANINSGILQIISIPLNNTAKHVCFTDNILRDWLHMHCIVNIPHQTLAKSNMRDL